MIKKSLLCIFFLALLVTPLSAVAELEYVAELRAEAEKRDISAQFTLAILYESGKGIIKRL